MCRPLVYLKSDWGGVGGRNDSKGDFSSVGNLGSVPELLRTFRDFILHFENKILAINKNFKFGCVAVVPCVSDK